MKPTRVIQSVKGWTTVVSAGFLEEARQDPSRDRDQLSRKKEAAQVLRWEQVLKDHRTATPWCGQDGGRVGAVAGLPKRCWEGEAAFETEIVSRVMEPGLRENS